MHSVELYKRIHWILVSSWELTYLGERELLPLLPVGDADKLATSLVKFNQIIPMRGLKSKGDQPLTFLIITFLL